MTYTPQMPANGQLRKAFVYRQNTPGGQGKTILLLLAIALGLFLLWNILTLPDVSKASLFAPAGSIQIFDKFDQFVCTVENGESRENVKIGNLPKHVSQALIAVEDKNFYGHDGVSIEGIGRAFVSNLAAGRVVQGGSTITQQLAKNLFFDSTDRSIVRKVKELFLALQLERKYSKAEILEMYLNQVYFGRGAYGIQRAANRYFNKDASRLNLAESAYLAGLLQAPSALGDPANIRRALTRQRQVLDLMVENGYITANQAKAASKSRLRFRRGRMPVQQHPYYVNYVVSLLNDEFKDQIEHDGLRIFTNMDPVAQIEAEKALNRGIGSAPAGVSQGALVSVSVEDGGVIAMVGGAGDYLKYQFNRAVAPHTMGSSFKPFVYLTAFRERALSPDSYINDEPIAYKMPSGTVYEPKNFDGKFMGAMTIREALALSRNTCAVQVANNVGIADVIETARLAGLGAKLDENLSLALGSSAASPLDMAGAYGTLARNGVAIEPWVVRRVESRDGRLLKNYSTQTWNAFHSHPVAQVVGCMQTAVESGTGQLAKLDDRPVAGKTGTSDSSRDLWFVGFTPDTVTAVWGGNDQNKPIAGSAVTGGMVMARIFKNYAQAYYRARPHEPGTFGKGEGAFSEWFRKIEQPKPDLAEDEQKPEAIAPDSEEAEEEVDPEQMQLPAVADPNHPQPADGEMIIEMVPGQDAGMPPTAPDANQYRGGSPQYYGQQQQQNGVQNYGQTQQHQNGIHNESIEQPDPEMNSPMPETAPPQVAPVPAPDPMPAPNPVLHEAPPNDGSYYVE